jgi:hypothetical protein
MRIILTFLMFTTMTSYSYVLAGDDQFFKLSSEVELQYRYFQDSGSYGNDEKSNPSITMKPEVSHSWDSDRKVFTFIPFYRYDSIDTERTHVDIRELSYVAAWESIELRAGISKVYWGVTENQHLVDIVNQTDLVESIDFEAKLGQPMINFTYISKYGNWDYFLLPYFRKRTFAGESGRFRGSLPIDTDSTEYESADEQEHIDHALRWSHYYESFEWGLSYFKGTDREPVLQANDDGSKLVTYYRLVEQYGLEFQYNFESLIFKGEAVRRIDKFDDYFLAFTSGFEYTFSNINGGVDIGVLYELNRDGRRKKSPIGLDNTTFIGSRVAFNDEDSSEFLFGVIIDNINSNLISMRFEGSKRINNFWKVDVELSIVSSPPANSAFSQIKDDDYAQVSFSYFL